MRIKEIYPVFMQVLVRGANVSGVFQVTKMHLRRLTSLRWGRTYTCAGQPSAGHPQGVGEGEEDCELVVTAGAD